MECSTTCCSPRKIMPGSLSNCALARRLASELREPLP